VIGLENGDVCMLQHAILFLKVMLAYLIPDKPEWVETSVAAEDFQSKLAFKRQVTIHR